MMPWLAARDPFSTFTQSVNQSINQPQHTYIAPCVANESKAHNEGSHVM